MTQNSVWSTSICQMGFSTDINFLCGAIFLFCIALYDCELSITKHVVFRGNYKSYFQTSRVIYKGSYSICFSIHRISKAVE